MSGRYKFETWHDACMASRKNMAVSEIDIVHEGTRFKAHLYKPLHGDGWLTFHNAPGYKVRKATTAEIDSRTRWDDY